MNHAPSDRASPGHCRFEGGHSAPGLHPIADRVADDPVRVDVLDRTQIELALIGAVFGNVDEPQAIRLVRSEDAADEIVVHRRPRSPLLRAAFLAEDAPPLIGRADPPRCAVRHRLTRLAGFVGKNAIADLRVLAVGVEQGVRPVRLLELRIGDRISEPAVIRLPCDPQNPAHPPRRESRRRPARGRAVGAPPACGGTSFSRQIRL